MNPKRLRSDSRGAIFVEHLIAYLPIMFFFMATWQLVEMCAAHLVLQRAASAAGRAAIVVLPDDPAYYGDVPKDTFDGKRKEDVKLAAALILAANPHFGDFDVDVNPKKPSGSAPLSVTVKANFYCFAGWASLVCGPGGSRQLTAKSTYAYQGASYNYEL
jgi:Flp pilus assembly protein TadG